MSGDRYRPKMKRTNSSLRPQKISRWGGFPKPNAVLSNNDIMKNNIIPYLDEWGKYNLSQVNKSCNTLICSCQENSDKHIMYDYFVRNEICMVCFTACRTDPFENSLHIFCHRRCLPSYKLFTFENSECIPLTLTADKIKPGMVVHALYDIINPFIGNKHTTLAYHTSRKFCSYHRLYISPEFERFLRNFKGIADSVSKAIEIRNCLDLDVKVRMGANTFSLYTLFNKVYPTSSSIATMVRCYKELHKGIIEFHEEMVVFFSSSIRPILYVKKHKSVTTWGHFIKENVREIKRYEISFVDWILQHDYVKKRDVLKSKMMSWLENHNRTQLSVSLMNMFTQLDLLFDETLPEDRINVYKNFRIGITQFCQNSPELINIANTVHPQNVVKQSFMVISNQMWELSGMFSKIYISIMRMQSSFVLSGVRICDFNACISRMIARFGIFHFDRGVFPERFLALVFKFHPLDILNTYTPSTFYNDGAIRACVAIINGRRRCVCENNGVVCRAHGLCGQCCTCNT